MIDDVRICLSVNHEPIGIQEPLHDGVYRSPPRISIPGGSGETVRARSVKSGEELVVEGSFIGFLQGHNIVGSMNLQALVSEVVARVLKHLRITPSRREQRAIDEGRIKLERLDVVGYLRVDHLGGPEAVLRVLDTGLAGSRQSRMIFPQETVVYHSHSKYWSLMAYDKAQQLQAEHPATWESLDPRVQDVARNYLRFELRQFRRELISRGWLEVRHVTRAAVEEQFAKRLDQLFRDLRTPYPALPISGINLSKALLLGLLAAHGVDFISALSDRSQRRVWQQLGAELGIDRRSATGLPREYRRTLGDLLDEPALPIRHGAPRALRHAGLVALR